MISRSFPLILLCVVMLVSGFAMGQDRQVDEITQQLFEQYVARQGKINTESVMAATHLVAERGRETGFWKNVLAELRRNNQDSEIGCVRVLGKMLATDAAARDVIRRRKETGEVSAWAATVCLDPDVVTTLLERGRKADRFRIDHYTIALARARVPEARDFFKSILRATPDQTSPSRTLSTPGRDTKLPIINHDAEDSAPTRPYHFESTRFHAAVGLAQLSDSEGIDWLVANCEFSQGTVTNAWPKGSPPGGDLSRCCLEALRHLSGEHSRTSKAEWEAWSKSVDKKYLLDHAVVFGDP
jgi:hypothetical protein